MWQSNFKVINSNPFISLDFLSQFFFDPSGVILEDKMLTELDSQISNYETTVSFNVREFLISRNEILSSLAISKAEQTNMLQETDATKVQQRLNEDPQYDPLKDRDVKNEKERHDRLELANIMKCYRYVSGYGVAAIDLSANLLQDLHSRLTENLDTFDYLPKFTPYRTGKLRVGPMTVQGSHGYVYRPVDYRQIADNMGAVIAYYKENPSILNLNLLNIALYAIHPFNNGNKRLCRILEHALLRDLGLNSRNTYSHIYYYHKQLKRFMDELLRSLEGKSFMPSINFSREAIFYSALSVLKFGLEEKERQRRCGWAQRGMRFSVTLLRTRHFNISLSGINAKGWCRRRHS